MDHPAQILTWTADTAGLSAARSKELRSAITTVEHCLGLWQSFIAAATTHPLHITATTTDDLTGQTVPTVGSRLDIDQWALRLQIPRSLLQETPSRLAAQIVDALIPAIVLLAEHHPHPQPPPFWKPPRDPQPPPDESETSIQLEDLPDGDVLVVGCHDGTPAGARARQSALAEYLGECLEAPAIAVYDHTIRTESAVGWNLEILPKD